MALLFMDGFDAGDFAMKWTSYSFVSSSTSTRFTSGRSITFYSASSYLRKQFVASTQIYTGCSVKSGALGFSANSIFVLMADSGVTAHISVKGIDSTYMGVYCGATLLGSFTYPKATWMNLELSATIADSGGTCVVKLEGQTVVNFVGDTKNGGTSTLIDTISLQNAASSGDVFFDDVYVCNSTGTTNNTFLGDVRVQTLVPSGVGTDTQLTPTGGANYANTADIPDNTSTYNSSSTQGQRDTYALADLLAGTGTIFGVQTNIAARKTDAGLGPLKEAFRSGGSVYYGPTVQLPSSTTWIGNLRETDPATSTAWTVSGVNALEGGAEIA